MSIIIYIEQFKKTNLCYKTFYEYFITLNNNVNYISNISNLEADKISIDFLNKNTKIQMNDEYKNVLVKSILKNGDN